MPAQLSKDQLESFLNEGTIIAKDHATLLLGFGNRRWMAEPKDRSRWTWYFPDFFLKERTCYFEQPFQVSMTPEALLECLEISPKKNELKWQPAPSAYFDASFKDLKQDFNDGTLQKAVPYLVQHARIKMDPLLLKHSLANALHYQIKHPHTSLYGFWGKDHGLLGVTPEHLFRLHREKHLKTMACAGTVPIAQVKQLLSSSKMRQEHQLVIDGIKNALVSFGCAMVGETKAAEFASIAHLVTEIELNSTHSISFNALIRALHPTPALGGYPKKSAERWLENYARHYPRLRYGAPVGVILDQASEQIAYVAIRNIQWEKNVISLYAGCGVVNESVLEDEKREIETKFNAVKSILGL